MSYFQQQFHHIDFVYSCNPNNGYGVRLSNNATCTKFINMLKEKLGLSNIGNLYLSRKDLENIMNYEI